MFDVIAAFTVVADGVLECRQTGVGGTVQALQSSNDDDVGCSRVSTHRWEGRRCRPCNLAMS